MFLSVDGMFLPLNGKFITNVPIYLLHG